jgi:tRNA pseudouridine32 synthase/23S rRNA pseudouridine746 synthase
MTATRIDLEHVVPTGEERDACSLLAALSGLPKGRIKDAMNKGAVWLRRGRAPARRLRRATAALYAGDRLSLCYDPELLGRKPPRARLLHRLDRYSVWYKPPGLMAQGNRCGDHCSLLRQAGQALRREVHLVHRLDREAEGLLLVAHDGEAAAKLSALFANRRVEKHYRVEVRGAPGPVGAAGCIGTPLDGKPALTAYRVAAVSAGQDTARLEVTIETGRLHQIRRHLDAIGHPVLGDPRYGRGNRNTEGLRLSACRLAFRCPFTGARREFSLDAAGIGGLEAGGSAACGPERSA